MTSVYKDEGMLDIGQHCTICRELDFLPFTCVKCGFIYCSKHREEYNEHKCMKEAAEAKRNQIEKVDVSQLPKSSEVFPDLAKIRKDAEIEHQMEQGKKIGDRLTKVLNASDQPMSSIEVAMLRLKKLLKNSTDSMKKSNKSKGIFGLGKKLGGGSSSKASRMIAMNQLKRSARGDEKISVTDRVYVWIYYNSDDDKSIKLKEAQYFSKKWPIGKMLDSSAKLSKIKNVNNLNVDSSLKLAMFRKAREDEMSESNDEKNEDFVYIPTNGRVDKEINDGDEIYILRGSL